MVVDRSHFLTVWHHVFEKARFVLIGMLFVFLFARSGVAFAEDVVVSTCVERSDCERQLADLETQIAEHEATITKLKTEGKTLQSSISRLNAEVAKNLLLIKAINLTIQGLNAQITDKESTIKTKEADLSMNREALKQSPQTLYVSGQTGMVELLLANPHLSDFFGDVNNLLSVKESLVQTIGVITNIRNDLVDQKAKLEVERSDKARAKAIQDAERAAIESNKAAKAKLLADTKGKEANFQKILADTRKKAAEIRSRIFQFLGGGEMTFDQAYQLAKLAEGATGIRAAFILAILDRESALGQNVGRCKYNDTNPVTGRAAMHPTRDLPYFLQLLERLGMSPDAVTVSCANSDGPYGGAMGPAQFIPSTWQLYETKIADVTNHNPPNPWNNGDAIVATGLYLKDSGAGNSEKLAAARYYCGGRALTNWVCLNVYGAAVVRKAADFQDDINVLKNST